MKSLVWCGRVVSLPLIVVLHAGCGSPKGETTACSVDGEAIANGTLNPQNQCQVCKAQTNSTGWSNIPAGTPCGQGGGSFCAGGSCQAGCYINSIFYPPGAPDPGNGCLGCQPQTNAMGWSPVTGVPPAGTCPDNGVCYQGHCQPGCTIGTMQYPAGAPNPDNFCQSCQPGQGASTWTDKPPGATCADGGAVCATGNCTAGCEIDGVFYSPGGSSPDNVCQTCQPKESVSSFSPATGLAPGGTCGNGSYCYMGQCSGGCEINGTSYAPGDVDPKNACMGCVPNASATSWSNLDPGTPCGGGGVCSGGTCLFGCEIGGLLYPPDTNDPAQVCQSCQPAVSATNWSPLTGIPTNGCTGGDVCLDGGCTKGCFIKKTYYPTAARKPGDVSQCCSPGTDLATWSPAFVAGPSLAAGFSQSQYYYPYYYEPQILAADFNRDGLSDILLLQGYSPSGLAIFMNQGDAGFAESYLTSDLGGVSAVAGDLNADGYPDLAVSATETIYVLTNQGDGGFGPRTGYASNAIFYDAGTDDAGLQIYYYYNTNYYYYYPYSGGPSVLITDVNRDGVPDVVAAGGLLSGTASVLLGIGDGGLMSARVLDAGFVSTYLLASADFNGDGWPDLLALGDTSLSTYGYSNNGYTYVNVYTSNPSVSVIFNDGTGSFGQPSTLAGYTGTPTGFAVADFNGDGTPDIALTSNSGDQLQILTGIGDGGFNQPVTYSVPYYYYYYNQIAVGDFNGDGHPDLVIGEYPALFLNKGDGTFYPGASLSTPYYTYGMAAARFLGSGPDDLAVASYNPTFTPFFNNCR